MQLRAVELRLVDAGLRAPIGTAAGPHRSRAVGFVRLLTDAGEGWGECAALPEGTSVDPPLGAVWAHMAALGVPRLTEAARARDGQLPEASLVAGLFGARPEDRMVAAALEMAVLDVELFAAGTPLWRRLGADPERVADGVPVGELVGIPADHDLDALVASVAVAAAQSSRVRLKIAPGWDLAPVRAVRSAFPGLVLQVDANCSYAWGSEGPDDVARLVGLDPFGLTCLEQPLAAADLPGHARLAQLLETPICLDESLVSGRRLADALRYGACEVACLKPGRLGGLLAARRAQAACLEAGIPAFVGGFFETGLARSANAALAALPGFSLPGDLSDPSGYLLAAPLPYLPVHTGRVWLSGAPGVAPRA